MDKLITVLIVVAVAGLFYYLSQQQDATESAQDDAAMSQPAEASAEASAEGPWVAMVGMGEAAHEAGHYASYDDCMAGVKGMVDIQTTVYSCTHQ